MRNRSGLKRITAGVLFFVAFASTSLAQQPAGPLQARDSGNRVVGPVCGDGDGPSAMVCRQVNGLLFRLPLTESGFASQTVAYFTSSDCMAPAYMVSSSNIYPGVNVFGNSAFVANVFAPAQTLTVNSRRTVSGVCELLPVPVSMGNMRAGLEFTGYNTFVPPFGVRAASAAAPLEAVDRDNRVVGQVCADGNGSPAMLCYQVDYLAFRLPLSRTGFVNDDEIFFGGTDCTSPAAVIPRGGIYPSANVAGSSAFVEDLAAPLQTFTANSKRDVAGACVLLSTPTAVNNIRAARELPNFNTFAAPFRVREAGADIEAPQPPAALSATAVNVSQVSLTWTPSLDNVGVAGYQLERCAGAGCTNFTLVASPAGVSFNDTGLAPSTTYNFRVRAVDSAIPPNVSGYSNTAVVTTPAPAVPTGPQNLTVTGATSLVIALAWTAPPGFAATEYHLERCKGNGCTNFGETAVTTGLQYGDDYRQTNASYTYRVRARNAAGTFTDYSNIVVGTAALSEGARARDVMFAMDGSGSVGSTGWTAEKNFVADLITSVLQPGIGTGVVVFADAASTPIQLQALTDTSAPGILSTVNNLKFPNGSTATLSGVQNVLNEFETRGYGLSEKWLFLITDGNPNPFETQNPCGTTAAAVDARARLAALNVATVLITVGPAIQASTLGCLYNYDSSRVLSASGFTEAALDVLLAKVDAYLAGSASGIPAFPVVNYPTFSSGQVNLTWAPAIDDDAIRTYVIERCAGAGCSNLAQIGSVAGNVLSYSDALVQEGQTYSYAVYPIDSEGNTPDIISLLPPLVSISISDVTPPSIPSALTATRSASGAIKLNWTASADNKAVTQYRVERCTGLGCSNFAQITTVTGVTYTDTNLTNNTSYSFRVRAADAGGNLSDYSNTATATADAQPPTTPTDLVAVSAGVSSISLSWTAATDVSGIDKYRIERCSGSGCTTFAEIGTATDTTFLDSNATTSTDFRYQVRAQDSLGLLSAYSNIARAGRPDAAPPTAPTSLTAILAGTSVSLSWTASTDGFAVANYSIERCAGTNCSDFTVIGTSTNTAYSDSPVAFGTTYSYRVRALDFAEPANLSDYSNTAVLTTPAPRNLTVTGTTTFRIALAWTAPQGFAATEYHLERCKGNGCTGFAEVAVTTGLAYNDDYRQANASYTYRVRARNAAGTFTDYSNIVVGTAVVPEGGAATDVVFAMDGSGSVTSAGWTTEKNFVADAINSILAPDTGIGVVVFGNAASTPVQLRLSTPGIVSTVNNLGYPNSMNTATLSGVQNALTEFETRGYGISRKLLFFITDGNPNPPETQNPCGTTAAAADARARLAALNITTVLITVGPDINPVTLGCLYDYDSSRVISASGFSALAFNALVAKMDAYFAPGSSGIPSGVLWYQPTFSSGEVHLQWIPSIDDDRVCAYLIQRCTGSGCTDFAQIGSVAGDVLSYDDALVQDGQHYNYRAYAVDSEGNIGLFLSEVGITIPDVTPPSIPSALIATPSASGAIKLNWTASTDNKAVTQYRVERCTGVDCSNFTQITTVTGVTYTNSNLTNNTSYSFRVRAADAAGNLSGYSNTANAIADAQPPTTPTDLAAVSAGASSISLSWAAATDASGIDKYRIERCSGSGCTVFAEIGTATDTTFLDSSATANTDFRYRVRAQDSTGLLSAYSNIARADRPDAAPPTVPTGLTATLQGTTVNLSWTASTDGFAVVNYSIERCAGVNCANFAVIASPVGAAYSDSSIADGTTYQYRVAASDGVNVSSYSNIAMALVGAPDNLSIATDAKNNSYKLTWTASPNPGVVEYSIERCSGSACTNFVQIATTTQTMYAASYTPSSSLLRFRIRGMDSLGNFTAPSNIVSGTLN